VKVQALCFSETSVNFYQTSRSYIPEDNTVKADNFCLGSTLLLRSTVRPRDMEFYRNGIIKRIEIHHRFALTEMCDKCF
jgi:hypothetical protein